MAYVFIDVSRKQEYIFRHNQLRNNLYHSMVIKLLTEDVQDFPHDQYTGITLRKVLEASFKDQYQFVYSGGGNSIIKWNSGNTAKDFIAQYTAIVLKEYPELELYISLVLDSDIQSETGMSRDMLIRRKLIEQSDLLKDKRRARFKRWSYGIERIGETGLPVIYQTQAQSKNLQTQIKLVKEYLEFKIKQATDSSLLQYTDQLQDYKDYKQRNESNSYIGVIAIDGNRMGELVSKITSFEDLNAFSRTIEALYTKAMIRGLNKTAEELDLKQPLLFTPIVMAGDDVCLIVPAAAAIQAAANIVQSIHELAQEPQFQNELARVMKADAGDPILQLHACAGVAIARYSYPFFELVRRAEAKCHDAKEAIHLLPGGKEDTLNASFLDWEIVQGQTESAKEPERNRYGERLRIRPLRLDGDLPVEQGGVFGYRSFLELTVRLKRAIQSEESREPISRTFLTELRRAFHGGWEFYKSLFELKRTDGAQNLSQLVIEIYPSSEFATIECCPGKPESRVYLLHDVLQVLRFIQPGREDQADAVAH